MTCRERTPVENLNVGDVVQAVDYGPNGTVIDADRCGWTVVEYQPRLRGYRIMSYRHGEEFLCVVRPDAPVVSLVPNVSSDPNVSADELALRLADVAATLATATTDDDGQIAGPNTGSFLAALNDAVRGVRGLEDFDEFQERRRQALARHGTYLGLSDPK